MPRRRAGSVSPPPQEEDVTLEHAVAWLEQLATSGAARQHALPCGEMLLILCKLAPHVPLRVSPPALICMCLEMVQSVHLLSPAPDAPQAMYVTVTLTQLLRAAGRVEI